MRTGMVQQGLGIRCLVGGAIGVVVALVCAAPVAAQDGTVAGVVMNATTLAPVADAQVAVSGAAQTVSTDAAGQFRLTGLAGADVVVEVRRIGYQPASQRVVVGTENVRILLHERVVELGAVVVTGTVGGVAKRAIGNVVTQIDASDAMQVAPIPNIQSLLNARAPGVVVSPGTGMVGSGSQIRIRGSSSFSLSSQPLVYVDGVRVDNAQSTGPTVQAFGSSVVSRINDFDPDDIESIEIIKGPAAATLYGTEASNGVIQIITKRGQTGKPTWSLAVRQGANWLQDAADRIPVNYWRNTTTGQIESINLYETEMARGTPTLRTGHLQNYSLSLSGGSGDVRYYLSTDFDRDEGSEFDNNLKRVTSRANLTIQASPTLEISGKAGYVVGRYNLSCEAGCGGVTWNLYFSTPEHAQNGDRRRGSRSFPPEYYRTTTDRFQNLGRFTGSLSLDHRPTNWLRHRLLVGVDAVHEDNQEITEKTAYLLEWSPTARGGKGVDRRDVTYNTMDYSATVTASLSEAISSNTSLGAQFYRRQHRFVSASGADFALPGLTVIDAAAERLGGETFVENTTVGVFGEQQFGWNDRLFLTLGLRADDNSAFGEEFDLVYYPKVSATWVISEESFFHVPSVNTLRLRSAYGHTGLQPGAFDALRTYLAVPGPDDEATITPGSVGNPALGPERGVEVELGFDAGLFDDRFGVEFTWYDKRTRDAILLRSVAPSTGFAGSRFVNAGEIQNTGFEVVLRGQPVVRRNVKWDAAFSLTHNRSEILSLGEDDRWVISSSFGVEHRVGMPLGAWYHRKVVDADFDAAGQVITSTMMCADGNGGTTPCYSGTTPVAPYVFLGTGEPKWEGAVSSSVTLYDRLRLYALVDFKTGFMKWDHLNRVRCSLFNVCLENEAPLDYVNTQQDRARLAAYQTGATFGAEYIRHSSFAKLREISVTYLVPDRLARRIGASRASISVGGRNLHTWTGWTGIDPEARFLSGARGGFGPLEQNHLPQLTTFVTSVNVTF